MQIKRDILWLLPAGYTTNRVGYVKRRLSAMKFNDDRIKFHCAHETIKGAWVLKPKSKTKRYTPPEVASKLHRYICRILEQAQPPFVVINDLPTGRVLFPDFFIKDKLSMYRGSKLTLDQFPNTVFIVIDDVSKAYMKFETERINSDTFAWILDRDLGKLIRHVNGTNLPQRPLDYTLCTTRKHFEEARDWLRDSMVIGFDCETSGATISCTSFVGIDRDGVNVRGWTFPVFDGSVHDGIYWEDINDELYMWSVIKEICENDVLKIAQNGSYDEAYLFKYDISVRNFLIDTQLLMHSFCGSMEKGLSFLASVFLDDFIYWKDEIKGDASNDTTDKTGTRVPKTKHGIATYYEYCAKDSYNTLYVAIRLLNIVFSHEWSKENYLKSFMLQHGPMMQMTMTGLKVDLERRELYKESLSLQKAKALQRLTKAIGGKEIIYNPNSSHHNKELFFDILRLQPPKGLKKTTEAKALRRMAVRNPLAHGLLRLLTDYKKPNKLMDDVTKRLMNGRFMYSLNAVGTWTGRASSSKHHYWVGSNAQNLSKKLRPQYIADDGMWLVPIDFSQSDAYFVAFESEDQNYMKNMEKNMNTGYDTHSYHVEVLLGVGYDEVIAGKNSYDPKIIDPILGVRQIIKRVVHGTNYEMADNTMLTTVGVVSMIEAAQTIGWFDANMWDDNKLRRFTKTLNIKYNNLYPKLAEWKDDQLTLCHENKRTVTCYGGRTHYVIGNPMRDTTGRIRRQVSAFLGQGGTAGNINRSVLSVYYDKHYVYENAQAAKDACKGDIVERVKRSLSDEGVTLINQVHDEIVFGVPHGKEYLIDNLLSIMEEPITIKGRTFHVPCEAELGLSWQILLDWEGYSNEKDFSYYHGKAMKKERSYNELLKLKGLKL